MIHWKNRPIEKLSQKELKQALQEAVAIAASKNATPQDQIFDSFLLGLAIGVGVSIFGMALISLF